MTEWSKGRKKRQRADPTGAKDELKSQNTADALAMRFCNTSKAAAIWLEKRGKWAKKRGVK